MVEHQWVQWVPLFGFGSVLTILIAIVGVGIGLWRNASIAHRNINDRINRMGSRLEFKLSSEICGTPRLPPSGSAAGCGLVEGTPRLPRRLPLKGGVILEACI